MFVKHSSSVEEVYDATQLINYSSFLYFGLSSSLFSHLRWLAIDHRRKGHPCKWIHWFIGMSCPHAHTCFPSQFWVFSRCHLAIVPFFKQPIRSHLLLFSSTLLLHSSLTSLTKQGRGNFKRFCCLVFFPTSLFLKPRVKLQSCWDDNTESSKGLMLCVCVQGGMVHAVYVRDIHTHIHTYSIYRTLLNALCLNVVLWLPLYIVAVIMYVVYSR